jgi:hypothetical protein
MTRRDIIVLVVFILLAIAAVLFGMGLLTGCTAQERAKKWGGTASVTVPTGQKVVGATWKGENVWVLTRARRPDEKAEAFTLRESSSWGVVQGAVVFVEQ